MAFIKIEKLKNCLMKWGLIYLVQTGYVTNLKYLLLDLFFLKLRGTAEIRVGNTHLTEEVLKQLGLFQEYLAECPRSQNSLDSKNVFEPRRYHSWWKQLQKLCIYTYIHTQAYSTCAYLHVCTCIYRKGIKNQQNENDYKLQIEMGNEVSKLNE